MRKSNIVFIVLLSINLLYGQTKEEELSNAEKFSRKSGTLIEKTFIDINTIKDVKVQVLILTDLIENSKVYAVKMEYEHYGKYNNKDTKVALLDPDEVDGLIESITILQGKIFNSSRSHYTEVIFRSRDGFESGCYYSKGAWSTFLKLEKYDNDSYVFLKKEDFTILLSALKDAKRKFL